MIIVKVTKQELWDIGFAKVVIDGVEYVDKTPLIIDSSGPLAHAYQELLEKKRQEYLKQRQIKQNAKNNRKGGTNGKKKQNKK